MINSMSAVSVVPLGLSYEFDMFLNTLHQFQLLIIARLFLVCYFKQILAIQFRVFIGNNVVRIIFFSQIKLQVSMR